MSQTSDRHRSNSHKEKRRERHRWRKRCRDRLGLCLLLFCWITPSSEDWTHSSCSVMGPDRRRARDMGNGGGYMCERNGGRGMKETGEREDCLFYGSLLNRRWPRQIWRRERLLGCFNRWAQSGFGPVFPLHIYTSQHLIMCYYCQSLCWKTKLHQARPHTVAFIWNHLHEELKLTKSSSFKTLF